MHLPLNNRCSMSEIPKKPTPRCPGQENLALPSSFFPSGLSGRAAGTRAGDPDWGIPTGLRPKAQQRVRELPWVQEPKAFSTPKGLRPLPACSLHATPSELLAINDASPKVASLPWQTPAPLQFPRPPSQTFQFLGNDPFLPSSLSRRNCPPWCSRSRPLMRSNICRRNSSLSMSRSVVAQIFNLPYRRVPLGWPPDSDPVQGPNARAPTIRGSPSPTPAAPPPIPIPRFRVHPVSVYLDS